MCRPIVRKKMTVKCSSGLLGSQWLPACHSQRLQLYALKGQYRNTGLLLQPMHLPWACAAHVGRGRMDSHSCALEHRATLVMAAASFMSIVEKARTPSSRGLCEKSAAKICRIHEEATDEKLLLNTHCSALCAHGKLVRWYKCEAKNDHQNAKIRQDTGIARPAPHLRSSIAHPWATDLLSSFRYLSQTNTCHICMRARAFGTWAPSQPLSFSWSSLQKRSLFSCYLNGGDSRRGTRFRQTYTWDYPWTAEIALRNSSPNSADG